MILEQLMNKYVLKNRYSLLLTVIVGFILVVVSEGLVTNREAQVFSFENPYFELNLNDLDGLEYRRQLREDIRREINR